MEASDFEIFSIEVTFYLYRVQRLVSNVLIENKYNRHRRLKG